MTELYWWKGLTPFEGYDAIDPKDARPGDRWSYTHHSHWIRDLNNPRPGCLVVTGDVTSGWIVSRDDIVVFRKVSEPAKAETKAADPSTLVRMCYGETIEAHCLYQHCGMKAPEPVDADMIGSRVVDERSRWASHLRASFVIYKPRIDGGVRPDEFKESVERWKGACSTRLARMMAGLAMDVYADHRSENERNIKNDAATSAAIAVGISARQDHTLTILPDDTLGDDVAPTLSSTEVGTWRRDKGEL